MGDDGRRLKKKKESQQNKKHTKQNKTHKNVKKK
jgi:hypothetical protein